MNIDAVVAVVLSDGPFEGEEVISAHEGCCVCHPEGTVLSKPFEAIKEGRAQKVILVGRVSNEVLQRMVRTARLNNILVLEDVSPQELTTFL